MKTYTRKEILKKYEDSIKDMINEPTSYIILADTIKELECVITEVKKDEWCLEEINTTSRGTYAAIMTKNSK